MVLVDKSPHKFPHILMKRFAARDDDANSYRAVSVQPFVILKISIVKRVFIVPFDFERDASAIRERAHMINLVRLAFLRIPIDRFHDNESGFDPSFRRERLPQTLRALGLTATTCDDLFYGIVVPAPRKVATKAGRCKQRHHDALRRARYGNRHKRPPNASRWRKMRCSEFGLTPISAWLFQISSPFTIIVTTAATLHVAGITNIQTSSQAETLRPVAGHFAFTISTLGILGTGLLAVPVLAGSAAYAIGEARKWQTGLARLPLQAKAFYATLAMATLVGIALNCTSFNPIQALFWSAVSNSVVAVPVMVLMMLLTANTKVMGQFGMTGLLRLTGWLATAVMAAAVVVMLVTAVL